jgi:VanZ family protein
MTIKNYDTAYARLVGALCACVLCGILVAGLWPFHVPGNQVKWRENDDGLDFGRYGSVLSTGTFPGSTLNDESAGSIEIWLEPRFLGSKHTILSFDGSDHPGAPFSLHQYNDALVLHQHNVDSHGTARTAGFRVDNMFREKRPVFLTIALGKQNTLVYLDGSLLKAFPIRGTSTNNLTGRLVVANSPGIDDSWSGQILGLVIYHRQLTAAQVAQHYEGWTKNQRPALAQDDAPVALYLFNEHAGDIVHNQLDPETDLVIPKRYFVLHSAFLRSPWREYHPSWSYWKDVGINIAGFIPMGFCVVAYFSSVRTMERAAAATIVLGFVTSLTIETLQAFLPTRDSGMTDLITNTLGTAIGVILYRLYVTQQLLTKVKQYGTNTNLHVHDPRTSNSLCELGHCGKIS